MNTRSKKAVERRSKIRKAKRSKRLGALHDEGHHIALHRALNDVKREVEGAKEAGLEGACLEMGTAIDRAWYNLGKADAHYLALGADARDLELNAIAGAQRAIRTTDNKFESTCVRRKPE